MRTAQTRSRDNSLRLAMETLAADLDRQSASAGHLAHNSTRRSQIGSGQKADRRRTFRFQDDRATDHLTGKSAPCTRVMSGRFDLLSA